MKKVHQTFNDGFLEFGTNKTKRDNVGKKIGAEFYSEGKLAFEIMNARERDYDIASANNNSLDLKVKTPLSPNISKLDISKMKCKIDKELFDVIEVDKDKSKKYLYIYLQKVGDKDE